jgi:uncharacterized protein
MAMTMTGEATLPAPRPKVWALLNDPDVLKACIPGCQSLERVGDHGFAAVARVKIGPVAATFKGKVQISDIVPDVGYTIVGEGEGGVAGFAKGGAKVSLADAEGGTVLSYAVEAQVGGKIAQLGSRLIDGVAKSMADKFFSSFAEAAARFAPAEEARAHPAHAEAHVTHHFSAAEPQAGIGAPIEPAPAAPIRPQAATERPPAPIRPQPFAGSASAPAPPTTAAAPPAAPRAAAEALVSPPKKKSWFRRIWEWFTSR